MARGLRCRSPLIVLAAALLLVLTLAALQWFVTSGAFTVIPERLMLRIPNDDYVNLSYKVAKLKRTPPTTPVVYLFGGSGAMEMTRSEGALADAIAADSGSSVRVVSLAAHAQSIGQTLALIDNLPHGRGLLAIGLSPNRLITAPATDASQLAGSPLALTSPHLAAQLSGRVALRQRLPGLLPGIFDFAVSYLNARLFTKSPDLAPIDYDDHYYTDGPIATISAKEAGQAIELAREWPQFAANAAYNLTLLAACVRLGRVNGYAVPSLSSPSASRQAARHGTLTLPSTIRRRRRDAPARSDRRERTAAGGTARSRLRRLFHLVNSGRDKWTPPFARDLASLLKPG